jgi:hypothetical protein
MGPAPGDRNPWFALCDRTEQPDSFFGHTPDPVWVTFGTDIAQFNFPWRNAMLSKSVLALAAFVTIACQGSNGSGAPGTSPGR